MSSSLSFLASSQQLWLRPKLVGVAATPFPRTQSRSLVVEAKATTKRVDRTARHTRIRKKVEGTPERPRLAVFRSHKHIYVQVIDDTKMHTLASASTMQKPISEEFDYTSGPTVLASARVGRVVRDWLIGARGLQKKVFLLLEESGDDGSERSPKKAFSNKKSALLQLVEGSLVPKSIIFCNKIETCRKVENMLMRFDRSGTRVRVLPFHSALAQGSRLANMEEFTNSNSEEVSQFLVCTDRASRGIDFSVWIMLYSSTSLAIQVCATCRKNNQRCCRNREGIHLCDGETSLPCRKDNGKKPKRSPGA